MQNSPYNMDNSPYNMRNSPYNMDNSAYNASATNGVYNNSGNRIGYEVKAPSGVTNYFDNTGIAPLTSIIDGILGQSNTPTKELRRRLKVFGMSARKGSIENFEEVGNALLTRKRLHITYYARGKDETTEREISPQRLIFYRDNWYLDAYCHLRKDLRSFSVDCISKAIIANSKADEISEKQLHEHFAESYGIFSGKANQRSKLKFSPEKARWVSSETWHGQQVGAFDKEGNYLLEFDYNQDPELVMDILKYGAGVEVLAPTSLRKRVKDELTKALNNY